MLKILLIKYIIILTSVSFTKVNTQNDFKEVLKFSVENKPVIFYKNVSKDSVLNMKIIYKIIQYNNSTKGCIEKVFFVKEAPKCLKAEIGANYILSQIIDKKPYTIDYPFTWENKNIDLKDLKLDCIEIMNKKVAPIQPCH
ncbi:MAG: hypothetical protein JNJ40_06125 [Bacteroidia bacterium]|nr:hypothetical protein [Bacteroidia bacterium]